MPETPATSARQPCRREDALAVLRKLRDAGHVAYFAGGCVRDLLLGMEPKDWDVATDAIPTRVREIFPRTQAVGAKFGVILVREGASVVEVATFRTDVNYEDGRHPTEVKFTTAEEDAKRRDFTINGLFLDPLTGDQIIDFVGGQDDLQNKTLRAIGAPDHRFEEDHLRMLRAVRFAARFGFAIESATFEAIRRYALELRRISPERIAEELRMMLTPPTRTAAYLLLRQLQLFGVIFRFSTHYREITSVPSASLFLTLSNVAKDGSISFGLALAALAIDLRVLDANTCDLQSLLEHREIKSVARALRQSLRLSNSEVDQIVGIQSFGHLLSEMQPTVAQLKRFLAAPSSNDARLLMSALADLGVLTERIRSLLAQLQALAATDFAPPPLLSGDDLVAAGFTPGPKFKQVLNNVYDAQLEDRISTKDQALARGKELLD